MTVSPELRQVIDLFSKREDVEVVRSHPKGNCGAMATRFALACIYAGFETRVAELHLQTEKVDDNGWHPEVMLYHYATEIVDVDGSNVTVDWTAHQFESVAGTLTVRETSPRWQTWEGVWVVVSSHTLVQSISEDIYDVRTRDLPDVTIPMPLAAAEDTIEQYEDSDVYGHVQFAGFRVDETVVVAPCELVANQTDVDETKVLELVGSLQPREPVMLLNDGSSLWIFDGNHRVAADLAVDSLTEAHVMRGNV